MGRVKSPAGAIFKSGPRRFFHSNISPNPASDRTKIIMAMVGGRRRGERAGFSLDEMANLLIKTGRRAL